jgi:hypothetical protein
MIAGGVIANGKAKFYTKNLHGIYAVVSAGRQCNSGAVNVEISQAYPNYNGYTNAFPTIYASVKSNIEFGNENRDIREDMITVTLDGTVIYTDEEDGYGWSTFWDDVSGSLITEFVPYLYDGCFEGLARGVVVHGYYDENDDYYYYYYDDDGVYYECRAQTPNRSLLGLTPGEHTIEIQAFNKAGYCGSDSYTFMVDDGRPDVDITTQYVCTNPCIAFSVHDLGSGVDWETVFIDVYDITGSEFSVVPKDKLIHTETPDAWEPVIDGDSVYFCLTDHIADGRRIRVVIYNGSRYLNWSEDCGCQYWEYNYPVDGVADMVGNRTQIVEEDFTVSAAACVDPAHEGVGVKVAGYSSNPFDPWKGEKIAFALNGFALGGGSTTAAVYDLTGEKVRALAAGLGGVMEWDGKNEKGDIVAEAVYLVHFQRTGGSTAGANSQALKIVVKRDND